MTTPDPVTPVGPATVPAVADRLSIPQGHPEYDYIGEVVAAVNDFVSDFHTANATTGQYRPKVVTGANMLAARIVRRRNSPSGVESFSDLGATYIARFDPDIEQMLELGGYRRLVVG